MHIKQSVNYFQISERFFKIKKEESYSEVKEIKSGVSQGGVPSPDLYLL